MASQEKVTVHNLAGSSTPSSSPSLRRLGVHPSLDNPRLTLVPPPDLKNTSDDAIPNYLNSLKFTQSHTLIDVRLALGYGALALAGACCAWDYKLGFENTKLYSAIAVALYTLINTALTLWIWLVENGVVYEGTSPSGDKVRPLPAMAPASLFP